MSGASDPEQYTEFPFASLRELLTPNDQFYLRSHFTTPVLSTHEWHLRIEGAVRQPVAIGYDELRALPPRTTTAVMECAGNNRAFLSPPVPGVPWQLGGVSSLPADRSENRLTRALICRGGDPTAASSARCRPSSRLLAQGAE